MDASGKRRALLAVVVVGLIAAACSGVDEDDGAGSRTAQSEGRVDEEGMTTGSLEFSSDDAERGAPQSAAAGGGGTSAEGSAQRDPLAVGPKVIKTAAVRIEVPRKAFRRSVQEAVDVAEGHGGFVLTSEVTGDERMRGSVVLRVPAEEFVVALSELRGLGELKGESVSGEDVSEEFVDLEARLRNLEAQETVLLRLMDRAQTVGATIRVQRELSGVQLEIERLRGRLRFLEDQTAFGTIRLNLVQAGVAPPQEAGTIARAWEQAKDTATAVVSGVIVATGFVLPIGLLLALVALVVRIARPRITGTP